MVEFVKLDDERKQKAIAEVNGVPWLILAQVVFIHAHYSGFAQLPLWLLWLPSIVIVASLVLAVVLAATAIYMVNRK